MNEATVSRTGAHWRQAVWGLRVAGPGLTVVAAGLVTLIWSVPAGWAIVAAGMGVYLVGMAVTVAGVVLVYRDASPARPNIIWLRWSLLHDAVHARSATAGQLTVDGGGPDQPDGQSSAIEELRRSVHWSGAVWATRMEAPGLVLVLAGLVTLSSSTTAGRALTTVGLAILLVGIVVALTEAVRAHGDLQPPRLDFALVQRTLAHDALHARP